MGSNPTPRTSTAYFISSSNQTLLALYQIEYLLKVFSKITKARDKNVCYPKIDYVACSSCLSCLKLCPYNAMYVDVDDHVKIDYSKCRLCPVCFFVCPYGAIVCQWVPIPSSSQGGLDIHHSKFA
uniref:4Fe-4S dicluster domain-containing protein n=1 Tax=Ignisphaera aggregans TaxID=334771 RepID=A0A7C4FGK5_9CREN